MASNIEYLPARSEHVKSLETILARAFFPINPVVKRCLPDNDEMRTWWAQVYDEEISNANCHPFIAIDTQNSETAIGVCTLRLLKPGTPYGGFWTEHPWTPSHGAEWKPPIDCMVHYEESLMPEPHYILELMGVDHAYKSRGIGKALVAKACGIADEGGLPIFVQSGSAKDFYLKLRMGFEIVADRDWEGYRAVILVRVPGGGKVPEAMREVRGD